MRGFDGFCLYHHSNQGFCAGRAHQHPAIAVKHFLLLADLLPKAVILHDSFLCSAGGRNGHIDQLLWILGAAGHQLGSGQTSLAIWCFAMIAAILPYIMLNLGILGRRYKVFMGDAGSTLIGFTVIWILLETTQGKTHPISPVTALWIIAIPLMDMVAIMYRRLRKGMSPFSPDRQHIHHLIMRAGFTSRQAFVLITLAAALLASIGVLAEYSHFVPEWVMLVLFLLAFFLYGYCIKRAWKVARFIKRVKRRLRRNRGGSPNLTK